MYCLKVFYLYSENNVHVLMLCSKVTNSNQYCFHGLSEDMLKISEKGNGKSYYWWYQVQLNKLQQNIL